MKTAKCLYPIDLKINPTTLPFLMVVLMVLLLPAPPALSAASNNDKSKAPVILEIMTDVDAGLLTILGSGFDSPEIRLGADPAALTEVFMSEFELVLELPVGLIPGDYLMSLKDGKSKNTYDFNHWRHGS